MSKITVTVAGASGFTGGELLRLLLFHPRVEVIAATSERNRGKPVALIHPNLYRHTRLRFSSMEELPSSDFLFLALPHGESSRRIHLLSDKASKIIDLSADFRIADPTVYRQCYGKEHPAPEWLSQFIYGIVEVNRERIRTATRVSGAGCNATAAILALWPLAHAGLLDDSWIICDIKTGTSQAGAAHSAAGHHPVRSGSVRSYKPTGHRHGTEIRNCLNHEQIRISTTGLDIVRGILATCHLSLPAGLDDRKLRGVFRAAYAEEPFIRIVKKSSGVFRYPDPRLLAGSNICDIGFEINRDENSLVVLSALDNLMKGAAGQAIHCMNLMAGFPETCGLQFQGLYP
ncbi:MAG TPA: N-acetyl-gamma-glutamyl-phosphate reductase [Candidatus Aminicenantes bacterium]|nr:N-acetyl-gamma-glutamyl-phosphate reductase [Candidatus Aminicenantes bacterium]